MTDWTSLKVPRHVRDRLATAAQARGLTVRALLDDLSRKAADDALMEQAAAQMEHRGADRCLSGANCGSRRSIRSSPGSREVRGPFWWYLRILSTPGRSGWSLSFPPPPATGDSPTMCRSWQPGLIAAHSSCPNMCGRLS